MRKFTLGLAILGMTVWAALLFAPSFRQALAVTTNSWAIIAGGKPIWVVSLQRLAEQARTERDANTLAFVALELPPGAESEQLADEAVRLDPKLTWIYGNLASRYERKNGLLKSNSQAGAWIGKVKAWDPSNSYPELLEVQRILSADGLLSARGTPPDKLREDQRWMPAMTNAFVATKYDSYFAARMDLVRDVMTRRDIRDPMLAVRAFSSHSFPFWAIKCYALLTLEPRGYISPVNTTVGERSAPVSPEDAWRVARFGQVMSLQGQTMLERLEGAQLQRESYKRLAKLAKKIGDRDQQALLAYQIESLDVRRHPLPDNRTLWWNAAAGQVATAAMLVSVVLLLVWIADLIVTRRTALKEGIMAKCLRASGIVGGCGLLASSVALYISYHPYAELFNRFVQGAGADGTEPLMSFWGFAESPWKLQGIFSVALGWIALLFLAACLLAFEVYRFFSSHAPTRQTL
jgi:hypothetical protein